MYMQMTRTSDSTALEMLSREKRNVTMAHSIDLQAGFPARHVLVGNGADGRLTSVGPACGRRMLTLTAAVIFLAIRADACS